MATKDFSQTPDDKHLESGGASRSGSAGHRYVDHRQNDDRAEEAKGRYAEAYNKRYWLSVNYIGSLFAIGMAFMGGIGGYGLIAPILTQINEDIGPSVNINWIPLVNLAGGAVFFLMVGQLSDIFGRRWFFIFGSSIALLGSIIGAVAKDVNTLIVAEMFIGIAVAFQQSFFWVVAELVPMKWRYIANSYCYLMTVPTSPYAKAMGKRSLSNLEGHWAFRDRDKDSFTFPHVLAARVAYDLLQFPGTWRNCFYFLIAINATSVLSWWAFYHPPTFSMLHRKKLATDLLKNFDWIGLVLYSGSLIVLYPWNSPQVISTTIIGGVTLFGILPAYEIFISKKGREPYLPLHLFKNIRFQSAAWNTAIGACVYYGGAIVFPQVVTTLYYQRGLISEYDIGTYAGLINMAFVFAQVSHGFVVWATRGPKWAMIGSAIIAAPLLAAVATDLDNKTLTLGLVIPGSFAIGIVESVSITTSTFPLRSQEEIGQGGGLSGSTRNFGSAIAVAIFTTTLNNRLLVTIPNNVYPVARRLGLPDGSLQSLTNALQGTGDYLAVQGLTPEIRQAVQEPYRTAFKQAASTVFLVTLAFSIPAIILAFFTTNNDKSTEDYVAGGLHHQKQEKHLSEHFEEISGERSPNEKASGQE